MGCLLDNLISPHGMEIIRWTLFAGDLRPDTREQTGESEQSRTNTESRLDEY